MSYIILAILSVYVLSKLSRLNTSVKILESEILNLKNHSGVEHNSIPTPVREGDFASPIQTNPNIKILEVTKKSDISAGDDFGNEISNWFKENLILKIGVLMILSGFGWFVSYAFMHNWIGPVGRISLGIIAGSLVTIFGTIRLYKNKTQGIAFTILGSALVVISILSGQYFYNFFSPFIVLSMVFLVSLYISIIAVAHSYEDLSVYGLLVALFAPYLSHTREMDPTTMYFYLLIVSIATIWVSFTKNWRKSTSIGITGILIYSLSIFWNSLVDINSVKYFILIISYVTSIIYLLVNIYSLIKNQIKIEASDVYLTVVNTIIIIGFTMKIVPTIFQSTILAGWMLIYAISGYFVFTRTNNEKIFYIHSLISVLILGIATSIELSGNTLVIAFAIESALICISSYIVTNKIKTAELYGLLLVIPFVMSLPSLISSKWSTGVIHSDFAVLAVLGFILVALGIFFRMNRENTNNLFKVHHFIFILSTFYVYAIIWLSTHALIQGNDTAVFISLFVYTIVGLFTNFYGIFKHHIVLKNYGMTLLILVVIRLIIVDVWNMELSLRIVTFVVLGILFISTAFISRNNNIETQFK